MSTSFKALAIDTTADNLNGSPVVLRAANDIFNRQVLYVCA
ncbi:hypothetical protein [Gloeocapsopsis dulcis]|nr:hypothetical protein [Gloeocapsopsis dulcis]